MSELSVGTVVGEGEDDVAGSEVEDISEIEDTREVEGASEADVEDADEGLKGAEYVAEDEGPPDEEEELLSSSPTPVR